MTRIGNTLRKRYDEGCIAAHALDILGDRWALLVVRELLLGPKRFGAVRAGLPGISANILTLRLAELEAGGVLIRRALPSPALVQVYELTDLGRWVRPVIEALCRWGAGLPGHDPRLFISPTALMLSMASMIDRNAAQGMKAASSFVLGNERFDTVLCDGALVIDRVEVSGGDLVFAGSANDMAAAVYGPHPLAQSVGERRISFSGDPRLGQDFVDLFSLEGKG